MSNSSSPKKQSYIAAYCKVCNTRVTPKAKFAGRRIKCPDCFTSIQLPTLEQYQQKLAEAKRREPNQPEEHEPYKLNAPIESPELPPVRVFEEQARIRNVRKSPKPPKRPFLSNVFEFPWSDSGTLARWGMISGGLTVTGLFASLIFMLVDKGGLFGAIPGLFLVTAQMVVATWSLSYASSCAFTIIQDTGAGLNKVEGWPEGGIREWLVDLMTVIYVFFASGFVSLLIAYPLQPILGMIGPPVLIIQGFLFPTVMLSALDADSVLLPYSEMTLRSLVRIPRQWLQMLGLLFGVWLTAAGILTPVAVFIPELAGVASGPIIAAAIFISARLIGRQAWLIGEDASKADPLDDDDN
ncbi:MAG: hypothetical protein HQ518_18190 [Rhodopirellula sp.]|nr:hypothetical protein [Rhodopirellula sp.]